MSILPFRSVRWILATVFALVLVGSAYGFAASNTVPTSGAGDGAGTISGYTIGGVSYVLNSTDPSKIDKVNLTVTPSGTNPQPNTLKAQVVSNGSWYTGTRGTGTAWSIDLSAANVSVLSADNLRIVAAQ